MVVTEGYEGYKMQWQLNKRKVGLNKWKAMYPKQNLDIEDCGGSSIVFLRICLLLRSISVARVYV